MPAFVNLHWLPIKFRVQFELLLLVYKSVHKKSPDYIDQRFSVSENESKYSLRSSSQFLLSVPRVNCSTFDGRAFTHVAPVLWHYRRLSDVVTVLRFFKIKRLKTFLFKKAFIL